MAVVVDDDKIIAVWAVSGQAKKKESHLLNYADSRKKP